MGFIVAEYGCGHIYTSLSGVLPWRPTIAVKSPLGITDVRRFSKERPCDYCEGGYSGLTPDLNWLDYERCMLIESQFGYAEFSAPLCLYNLPKRFAHIAYARRLELRVCLEIAWKQWPESHEWSPNAEWLTDWYERYKSLLQETSDSAFYLLDTPWRYPTAFELLFNFNGIAWDSEAWARGAGFFKYVYSEEVASVHTYWWYDKFKRLHGQRG